MTRSRPSRGGLALLALLTATGASAQNQAADKPRSTEEVAEDIVTQPVEDVGLDKKDIPEALLRVQEDPYSTEGLRRCADIRAAVEEMDAVLGEDLDTRGEKSRDDKRKDTAGSIGGALVGGLIPFRGLVREITGAAAQRRRYNEAVYAGVVRRSFLKGLGQQRGCRYPASPKKSG